MAYSMTGVGFGEAQRNGTTLSVELKSVNNRYLEISCRLPSLLSQFENDVRNMIRSQVQRGKLYVTISIQGNDDNVLGLRVDDHLAKGVHSLLKELRNVSGVQDQIRLEHLLHFSEVFESVKEPESAEVLKDGLFEALNNAVSDLKRMRQQEGNELVKDIVDRVQQLKARVDDIEKIAEANVSQSYERVVERVQKLEKRVEMDRDRLYTELALMADRLDVTEECVRLRSHHALFTKILQDNEVVGKKLNFLLQEMNREANTISNKASNTDISHLVVEMKDEIEKLREQVQNLE